MPYVSDAKLNTLIEQGLQDEGIQQGVKDANLSEPTLVAEVQKRANDIWAAASQEISEYDLIQNELVRKRQEVESSLPAKPQRYLGWEARPPGWALVASVILFTLVLSATGFKYFFGSLGIVAKLSASTFVIIGFLLFSAASILFALYYVQRRRRWVRYSREERESADAQQSWEAARTEAEKRGRINEIAEKLAAVQKTVDKLLLERPIKDVMRETINRYSVPSYDVRLTIPDAPGLGQVFDSRRTIDTSARRSLRYLLETMFGGSIGIAGPRGSGKSTLIESYCGPNRTITELKGNKILSVLASAPVEYDARDFILYLFSSVCQAVLELQGVRDIRRELHEPDRIPERVVIPPLIRMARSAPRLLRSFGAYLIVFGLALAMLLTIHSSRQLATTPDSPEVSNASAEESAPKTEARPSGQQQSDPAAVRFIKALDIKPGPILLWGILLFTAGYFIPVMLREFSEPLLRHPGPTSLEQYMAAPDSQREDWKKQAVKARDRGNHEATNSLEEYEYEKARIEREGSMPFFAKEAVQWLRDIKFQQSYSSGWSGALKLQLPIGLESGITRSRTLAQTQMSNPELVSAFTKYLNSIPEEFQIIIGIDELDKLESDEKAQRFLNEIKSVFGLQRCFYLISVSENAMSNFERRGLPFRDAFDSSFDNIVYVDYLSLAAARKLMEQRVVGRPIPFFCLSYCLSGGLARDLIRTFRHLLELRQIDPGNNDLSALCSSIVKADIEAKVRASVVSAKKIKLEPEVSQFLEKLYQMDTDAISKQVLLKTVEDLLTFRATSLSPPSQPDQDKESTASRKDLKDLSDELATYIYFSETLLEFFNNSLEEKQLRAAEGKGKLDKLARARQALAIDPSITRALLNDFRRGQKIGVPDFLEDSTHPANLGPGVPSH